MDREKLDKVITGLECCKFNMHDDCPYDDTKDCSFYLMHDASELLEELKDKLDKENK